jgi:hypothetical protein
MFKKIALSGLMLSLLSLPLLAQTTTDAPATTNNRIGRNGGMHRQMGDPATRARKMTDRMTKELGLDQTASQKVYDATLARAQKVDAIRKGSDDNKAKAQALKANADDYKAKLQSILTPDQFAKVQAMRKHHGRGGNQSNSESK